MFNNLSKIILVTVSDPQRKEEEGEAPLLSGVRNKRKHCWSCNV